MTVNQQDPEKVNNITNKPESLLKIGVEKFFKNKLSVLGGITIIIVVGMAVFAPWIAPFDPAKQDLLNTLAPPSMEHFLGTDELGRDVFSRLLYGARVSLLVSFTAVIGMKTIGVVIGASAGYFGKVVDSILMRFVDVIISFPQIFLLITMLAVLEPGLKTLIIVFILFSWTGTARLVRGEFLSLRNREFVLAARTMGLKTSRIMFRHILPNAMGPIIVSATLSVGGVILSEAGLSFLGLGIQPPTPSWGNMLQAAQDFNIMVNAWWYPIFPGLMILITVLAFNFVGDGLRDAFDPRDK
ncbi:oligopeptide ABC transporter permease [Oceanobacillus neutriphilus]|uniref:oligopeptide ABC transporter permease n=1 Tax=Oceanobacillus neutriphilus TaxID=531815 RepID=UPI001664B00D|nr:oligopeptide ABC transporter permease [Oceanobacillus neutriphilus]